MQQGIAHTGRTHNHTVSIVLQNNDFTGQSGTGLDFYGMEAIRLRSPTEFGQEMKEPHVFTSDRVFAR